MLDWQWTIVLLLVSSILVWWLSWGVYSAWASGAPLVFGSVNRLAGTGRFWLTWLVTTFTCFITGFGAEVRQDEWGGGGPRAAACSNTEAH